MDKHVVAKQHGKRRVWDRIDQVKSRDDRCMLCTCMHFVGLHLICTCKSFLCVIPCILLFSTITQHLISKASFSALGRVQLPQDCQIRLSGCFLPPSFTHGLYTLDIDCMRCASYLACDNKQNSFLLALTNVLSFSIL